MSKPVTQDSQGKAGVTQEDSAMLPADLEEGSLYDAPASGKYCPLPTESETPQDAGNSGGRQIARAAGLVMIAFVFSAIIGLVRDMLQAHYFGISVEVDSFFAANRISELLFNLLAGGALASAFIPMFSGFLARGERQKAWKMASGVINTLSVILLVITALAWVFAPQLAQYGLYALDPNPAAVQLDLTVRLLRIMLPTVWIFGVSGLVMGALNAHQVFLVPALAPVLYSLGMIFGMVVLPAAWGVERLAYGVVIGSAAHLGIQIPALLKLPQRQYYRKEGFRNPAVRQVLKLMVPRVIGAGVVQLNFVTNTLIALSLGVEGSVAAIGYAFRLMLMPQMAIAQSAGIASLPTLSNLAELGKTKEMRRTLSGVLRAVLLLAIPASIGLILLRQPLVQTLYQRGSFTERSTQMVSWALLWYAAGLVGHSLVEVLSRAFYALHDTRTPVTVGVIAMSINIGLSFAFVSLFRQMGWMAHGGLALANSVATGLECVVLWTLIAKRMQGLETSSLRKGIFISLAASFVMGAVLFLWLCLAPFGALVKLFGGLALGLASFTLMLWLMKAPELLSIWQGVRRRLGQAG